MRQANELLEALSAVIASAETQLATSESLFQSLATVGDDTESLKGAMSEMTRLEERMKTIIEPGGTLVCRLQPEPGYAGKEALGFLGSVEPDLAYVDPGVMVAAIGNDGNRTQADRLGYTAQ